MAGDELQDPLHERLRELPVRPLSDPARARLLAAIAPRATTRRVVMRRLAYAAALGLATATAWVGWRAGAPRTNPAPRGDGQSAVRTVMEIDVIARRSLATSELDIRAWRVLRAAGEVVNQ